MKNFNGNLISNVQAINEVEKKDEFQKLMGSIELDNEQTYDCTNLNVWSFSKGGDVREGINIKFGNMCNGFPVEIAGLKFHNSECAYIAGAYSGTDGNSVRIQREISAMINGLTCKRKYRGSNQYSGYIRNDFHTFNVQWMVYVVWQKCLQNDGFADLLKQIPVDAHVVENSSSMNKPTAIFWGAKNKELMAVRDVVANEVAISSSFRFKKDLQKAKMLASNQINNIGSFVGKNVMGKIIKVCSLSIIYGQQPPIDFDMLHSRQIAMDGKLIQFRATATTKKLQMMEAC